MYMLYKTALITTLVAACGLLTSTALTAEPRSAPHTDVKTNSIFFPTNSDGILSQCGDYFTFNPDKESYGVVPDEFAKSYKATHPMTVPVYGYMVNQEFNVEQASQVKQGENPYTIAEINRAMWDGHTFIWAKKGLPSETYSYVQDYADKWNLTHEKKVVLLTWNGENLYVEEKGKDRDLPMGREFGFSSWNVSQSCMSFSEGAFSEFMEQAEQLNANRDIQILPVAALTNGEPSKK